MIEIPLIDELREIRRKLAEACGSDPKRYADMLREGAKAQPTNYITEPLPSPPKPIAEAS